MEKIGSANYFWSFPSETSVRLDREAARLAAREGTLESELARLEALLAASRDEKTDTPDRRALQAQAGELAEEIQTLTATLAAHAANDPERFNALGEDVLVEGGGGRWGGRVCEEWILLTCTPAPSPTPRPTPHTSTCSVGGTDCSGQRESLAGQSALPALLAAQAVPGHGGERERTVPRGERWLEGGGEGRRNPALTGRPSRHDSGRGSHGKGWVWRAPSTCSCHSAVTRVSLLRSPASHTLSTPLQHKFNEDMEYITV